MLEIRPLDSNDTQTLCKIWNEAFGPEWPLTERLLKQTFSDTFFESEGLIGAFESGVFVGWALCKSMKEAPVDLGRNKGGLGAICVTPAHQRQGVGTALLKAAEAHLATNGSSLSLTYAPHHLLPGIPSEFNGALTFFRKHGYSVDRGEVHDLWRELHDFTLPDKVLEILGRWPSVQVRPAREEEADAVQEMVESEFPGGWSYYVKRHFAKGFPAREIIVVVENEEVLGFCMTSDFRSQWLSPATYWHPLMGKNSGVLAPSVWLRKNEAEVWVWLFAPWPLPT